MTTPVANATGGRNASRLVTLESALHEQIELILQEREQDTAWHEITALASHETREAAQHAFGEMRTRYQGVVADLSAIADAREEFAAARNFADQAIPERAAPTPAMMADRPTLREAFSRAAHSIGGAANIPNEQGRGLRVMAEDVNLTRLHAAIDVGTGNQGLDTPGAITPGTPLAFGMGMMMIDLFEARAFTIPNSSKVQWNAGASDGGIANFKLADGATSSADGVGNIGNYEDDLTRGQLFADVDMRAADGTTDAIGFAMESLEYGARHAWSNQAVVGTGVAPSNHGAEAYIGTGLAGATAATTQAFGAVTGAQAVGYLIDLRTALANRGWPPMVYAINSTIFGDLMQTQMTTGTGFDSVFGPLYSQMIPMLRGSRVAEIVRGFVTPAAAATWCIAYPFQGLANAIHWMQYFELLRDPYTQADDGQIRYRLFSWDAIQYAQPRALGTLTYKT